MGLLRHSTWWFALTIAVFTEDFDWILRIRVLISRVDAV